MSRCVEIMAMQHDQTLNAKHDLRMSVVDLDLSLKSYHAQILKSSMNLNLAQKKFMKSPNRSRHLSLNSALHCNC